SGLRIRRLLRRQSIGAEVPWNGDDQTQSHRLFSRSSCERGNGRTPRLRRGGTERRNVAKTIAVGFAATMEAITGQPANARECISLPPAEERRCPLCRDLQKVLIARREKLLAGHCGIVLPLCRLDNDSYY